jgi:hypothetical protein
VLAAAVIAVLGPSACAATGSGGPVGPDGEPETSAAAAVPSPSPLADPTPAAAPTVAPTATAASPASAPTPATTPSGQPDPSSGATPSVPPPRPTFVGSTSAITPELAGRMSPSWRPGCPVPLGELRYLSVTHWTFDGAVATGELVVRADLADGLVGVFEELFAVGYPIERMRLVDDFGADDDASMAANNTSAFNCRAVTGGTGWSEHSYGRALDLNPVQNPYVLGSTVLPPSGARYVDRPDEPGVLHAGDAVVTAFAAAGWAWGGEWTRPVDYQHFSTTGR